MPIINFAAFTEGEDFDAASLNSRFSDVELGLEGLEEDTLKANSLNPKQLPSLAGYVEEVGGVPTTPYILKAEAAQNAGAGMSVGPTESLNVALANMFFPPGTVQTGSPPLEPVDPDKWEVAPNADFELDLTAGNTAPGLDLGDTPNRNWAGGILILANAELSSIGEHPHATRYYAAFSIQFKVETNADWWILPRSLRYTSDKVIPPTILSPPHAWDGYPEATTRAYIDVPIRTVLLKEDIDFYPEIAGLYIVEGIRLAFGIWETDPTGTTYAASANPPPSSSVKAANLSIFPLHAATNVDIKAAP